MYMFMYESFVWEQVLVYENYVYVRVVYESMWELYIYESVVWDLCEECYVCELWKSMRLCV